jgi:plastocyanin
MNIHQGSAARPGLNRLDPDEGARMPRPRLLLALATFLVLVGGATALGAPSGTLLRISADPNGAMRFDKSALRAAPGRVTISMRNPAVVPHNVAVRGNGVKKVGKVVLKGGTSTVTANLRAGRYLLYCSVAGHEKAGMKGTLTVR